VALWIPQDLYVQLPNVAQLVVGSAVRVAGKVAEYKGEIEVVPQAVDDVTMLVVATLPEVTAHMGDLTAADKGRLVTVEGEIVEVIPFAGSTSSQGIKYLLDDGSGRITLLLWQNVYDVVPGKERLAVGASVRATGKVDEYRGELQIVPAVGGDVVLR
jgi:DNA/RNA endonuclease YhcR with UshA esterase domain